tara:strand:+ start:3832 stop:4527 length:696 start_codon:yes stop_codon:yes gene_type:complete
LKQFLLSALLLPTLLFSQPFDSYVRNLYDVSSLNGVLSYTLFYESLLGFYNLKVERGLSADLLVIVDFRQASREKRFYVYDFKKRLIIYRTWVAHGINSGRKYAFNLSNDKGSLKSSNGFYVTRGTYMGRNGLSLNIEGLDIGTNDNASERRIVIHGADYVKADSVGHSEGCLALPMDVSDEIINEIKDGVCLYVRGVLSAPKSKYLNKKDAERYFRIMEVSNQLLNLMEE